MRYQGNIYKTEHIYFKAIHLTNFSRRRLELGRRLILAEIKKLLIYNFDKSQNDQNYFTPGPIAVRRNWNLISQ